MSIDGASSYITHWYSVRRLQQAVAAGSMLERPVRPVVGQSAMHGKVKATYEHPFLGQHIDMLI